jgi:hypothetical protein
MLSGMSIGDISVDTLEYRHPNVLIFRADTLKAVSNVSRELRQILDRIPEIRE